MDIDSETLVAVAGSLAAAGLVGVPALDWLQRDDVPSWFRQRSAHLYALLAALALLATEILVQLPEGWEAWLGTAGTTGAGAVFVRMVNELGHSLTTKAAWRARLRQRAGFIAPFVDTVAKNVVGSATPPPDLPGITWPEHVARKPFFRKTVKVTDGVGTEDGGP